MKKIVYIFVVFSILMAIVIYAFPLHSFKVENVPIVFAGKISPTIHSNNRLNLNKEFSLQVRGEIYGMRVSEICFNENTNIIAYVIYTDGHDYCLYLCDLKGNRINTVSMGHIKSDAACVVKSGNYFIVSVGNYIFKVNKSGILWKIRIPYVKVKYPEENNYISGIAVNKNLLAVVMKNSGTFFLINLKTNKIERHNFPSAFGTGADVKPFKDGFVIRNFYSGKNKDMKMLFDQIGYYSIPNKIFMILNIPVLSVVTCSRKLYAVESSGDLININPFNGRVEKIDLPFHIKGNIYSDGEKLYFVGIRNNLNLKLNIPSSGKAILTLISFKGLKKGDVFVASYDPKNNQINKFYLPLVQSTVYGAPSVKIANIVNKNNKYYIYIPSYLLPVKGKGVYCPGVGLIFP